MRESNKIGSVLKRMFITRTQGFIDISKKRDFWKDLAKEYDGKFHIKRTVSRDLEALTLEIPYKQYLIKFTESDTHPLKISCEFNANFKLNFFISQKDVIEKLFLLFRFRMVKTGTKTFDKKYSIQGDNADLIKTILTEKIVNLILLNNVYSLNCISEKKGKTIQLSSVVSRIINSKSELSGLLNLFCLALDEMEKLNVN